MTPAERPTPSIRSNADSSFEGAMALRNRLDQLLDRLRIPPPQPVGDGKGGTIEQHPPLEAVIHRTCSVHNDCHQLMNEIEALI